MNKSINEKYPPNGVNEIYELYYLNDDQKTDEMWIDAVRKNKFALNFLYNHTPNFNQRILYEALKADPHALQYIQNPTFDMCDYAVKNDFDTIKYMYDDDIKDHLNNKYGHGIINKMRNKFRKFIKYVKNKM